MVAIEETLRHDEHSLYCYIEVKTDEIKRAGRESMKERNDSTARQLKADKTKNIA